MPAADRRTPRRARGRCRRSARNSAASANGGYGGGVFSGGLPERHDLSVLHETRIQGNFASQDGGGIFQAFDGVSTLGKSTDSVVSGNLPDDSVPALP